MPLTTSQRNAMERAQKANARVHSEVTQRRERIQSVRDKFWNDAQKGNADTERCIKYIEDLDEAD